MLEAGKTVWHFSIMRDEAHPLNYKHEYQIVFIEPNDGSKCFRAFSFDFAIRLRSSSQPMYSASRLDLASQFPPLPSCRRRRPATSRSWTIPRRLFTARVLTLSDGITLPYRLVHALLTYCRNASQLLIVLFQRLIGMLVLLECLPPRAPQVLRRSRSSSPTTARKLEPLDRATSTLVFSR